MGAYMTNNQLHKALALAYGRKIINGQQLKHLIAIFQVI